MKRKHDKLLNNEKRHWEQLQKRMKLVRRNLIRMKKRIDSMTNIIKEIKSRKDITSEAINIIERYFGNIPAEMLKRTLTETKKVEYSKIIRSFALTPHFYSAKAYEVRSLIADPLVTCCLMRQH